MDSNSHSLLAVIAFILTTLYTSNFWNFFLTLLGFALRFLTIYALLFLARPELEHFVARMEQKSEELLAVLKNSNLSIDSKVSQLLGVKSDIKQKNVPEGAVPPIFECLRLALASPHITLITAGFSTLGHFLKRLFIQELHSLVSLFAKDLISCLLDRLGDHKDRIRGLAAQAFTDMWPAAAPQIDRAVFEVGLTSKNARLRHASLNLLNSIVTQYHIGFRQYVPDAVACLEDADKEVRKAAKTVIVDLFKEAAPHAQADLQRQMADHNVRKTIVNEILIAIGLEPELPSRPSSTRPPSVRPPSRGDAIRRPPSRGDVLHRPPSRGDALHNSSSRANALQRPASRVDTSHGYSASGSTHSTTAVAEPASVDNHTAPVFHHLAQATSVSAPVASNPPVLTRSQQIVSTHPEQTAEALTEHASVIHRPVPTRPNTTATDAYKAPRAANAPADRRAVPATPRRVQPELDSTVQPRDISSAREMEQLVRDMLPCFNGKEDETNWQKREKNIIMLRRVTHGNAPHDFSQAYLAGIKTLLDPIFKVANSLRTTMQTTGLEMLQSLARVNGTRLDPMIDIILNNAMKLCGNSKKITAHNGNLTVAAVLENVTCNTRVLAHVTSAAASTNNNLRFFSAGWLRIVINGQGKHKTTPEGLASIAQCIKNGVSDARPENRESYRLTYWDFYRAWPDKARQMLNEIAPKHRATIEKDAANPMHDPMHDPFVSSSTSSTTGLFSSTPGRPTAAKAAIAAKARPNLAPATTFPPPTTAAQPAQANRPRKKPRSAVTGTPTSSLTSAPMRPGASKPRPAQLEINPRPATATGFHPTKKESPTRGSPTRIPVTHPTTPGTKTPGVTRPRQKSDPLQNASPTKMGVRLTNDPAHTPDRPFGSISIPKKRTNSSGEETGERKNDENTAPKKVVMDVAAHESPKVDSLGNSLGLSGWPHHEFKEVSPNECEDQKMLEAEATELVAVEAQTVPEAEPELKQELPGQSPADADEELHDIQTTYPNIAVAASQLQVEDEGSRHERALSPEVSSAKAISPAALPVAPEALGGDHNGGEKTNDETVEEAVSTRASANSGARRSSAILPLLPSWPKADNTPDSQPGDTPPLRLENEVTDTQDASNSGKRSADETPDVQVSRALRPFSDRPRESEATPTKRDITLRSQDPVQAREMLAKGIARIQTRDMDMNGYRKLQGLIDFHGTIFTDENQFDSMLEALLAELVTQKPPSGKVLPFGSVWDFKTQVLYTVKSMFVHSKTYFSGHYPGTVIQLLEAQKPYEIARYLVKVIDQLIDDIVDVSEPSAIVDALVDYLPTVKEDPQHKILRKGFETIGHSLVVMNERKMKLPEETIERIGELATDSLKLQSMGVKRRIIAMCVELRVMVADEDRYWKILGGADKGVHGLLFYYKSKHRVD